LDAREHDVLFLERDVPWYATTRDMPSPPYAATELYDSVNCLTERFRDAIHGADLVLLGSYVPDGAEIARFVLDSASGVVAFYDIDTPITLGALVDGTCEYLAPDLIPEFDAYLSFTGGPALECLTTRFGARRTHGFYCLVDPELYRPLPAPARRLALGFLGTYDAYRQRALSELLLEPATQLPRHDFMVAGPQYPPEVIWPRNVQRIEHIDPSRHRAFYASQRLTLNLTRRDMIEWGWSPSVRLFEAAACGVPIISDWWSGLDSFFEPGHEILIARSRDDVIEMITWSSDDDLARMAERARARTLREHTAEHRAIELEQLALECAEAAAR
jgi:spore maturation protein CgeB